MCRVVSGRWHVVPGMWRVVRGMWYALQHVHVCSGLLCIGSEGQDYTVPVLHKGVQDAETMWVYPAGMRRVSLGPA